MDEQVTETPAPDSPSDLESANVWVPHVVVGLAAVFLGLTTIQKAGYSYRKSTTPTTAAG